MIILNEAYEIDPNATYRQLVGKINTENIYRLIGVRFPEGVNKIYLYPGLIKHVQRYHPGIFESYYHRIPEIISKPDYIGKNPKESRSIELYKLVNENLLLAIKLDPTGYLFIASLYDLHNAQNKIQKRLRSGRIVTYTEMP